MNLGNVLSIGSNGLNAASHGTQTASQNISNATVPGYTRRIANLTPNPLDEGGGVRANGTSRMSDQFLEKRGLGARAYSGESEGRVKTLAALDTVFSDGVGTVGEALDAFDSALSDLTVTPNSAAVRQSVLSRAEDLAQAFHRSSDALATARSDANGRIVDEVSNINARLDEIGTLNAQIVQAKNIGQEPGDLQDKRDELIRGIATSLPVTVLPDDSGAVTVTLAGQRTLVGVDASVHHLIATTDATSGAVRIQRQTAGQIEDITNLFTSGSIGGTIAARDGALADAQRSLDALAFDLSTGYNTQHAAGYGLDGATARNFFNAPTVADGAARGFGVSADVAGQPNNIAAATDPLSLPSDNRNALALVSLRDQNLGSGGTATIQQSFSAMVAAGGAAQRSALDQADYANTSLTQIDALREAAGGVSTDEEMMSLMKFQRAYQASLRVIETADSMLSELLNMRIGG
jgi:flagellar hook-associated protein 1 FlgK